MNMPVYDCIRIVFSNKKSVSKLNLGIMFPYDISICNKKIMDLNSKNVFILTKIWFRIAKVF
jgi:hypothetical protein